MKFYGYVAFAYERGYLQLSCCNLQSMQQGDPASIGYMYAFLMFAGVVWLLSCDYSDKIFIVIFNLDYVIVVLLILFKNEQSTSLLVYIHDKKGILLMS